jgi:hypothetical protein
MVLKRWGGKELTGFNRAVLETILNTELQKKTTNVMTAGLKSTYHIFVFYFISFHYYRFILHSGNLKMFPTAESRELSR